jgi:7-cyano-7-deazaguanine synthase
VAKKAVILLSGGLDSTTLFYYAKSKGYKCHAIIFDYGQRHKKEIKSAKKIALLNRCPYNVVKFRLPWQGSALVDKKAKIPFRKRIGKGIPSTYVPARNTVFLSFAVSLAETINAATVFIGANAVDFSGYPDCMPKYYSVFNRIVSAGTKKGYEGKSIKILTPFIRKSKSNIIKAGHRLGVPYNLTWSCYRGGTNPCMKCDSCILRAKGFKEAGLTDPLNRKEKYGKK